MDEKKLIEVEIKSLLGSKNNAEKLLSELIKRDKNTSLIKNSKQLNHYFLNGKFEALLKKIERHIDDKHIDKINQIITAAKTHSVRTRKKNDEVILVVKATIDHTTSSNGIARLEHEITFDSLSLEDLDQLLLESEFSYQAKWSREREEYKYKGYSVSIDKNAGYGFLSEFEKVVAEGANINFIKKKIRGEMKELGIEELDQKRLERMFDYYNKNWREYYGTDKTFIIY